MSNLQQDYEQSKVSRFAFVWVLLRITRFWATFSGGMSHGIQGQGAAVPSGPILWVSTRRSKRPFLPQGSSHLFFTFLCAEGSWFYTRLRRASEPFPTVAHTANDNTIWTEHWTSHPRPFPATSRAEETFFSTHLYTVFQPHQLESSGPEQPDVSWTYVNTHTIHVIYIYIYIYTQKIIWKCIHQVLTVFICLP